MKKIEFQKNAAATALLTIGVLCICGGVLAALIIWGQEANASYYDHDPNAVSNAIGSIIGGIVSGVLFIGFSKCIQFLSDIKQILLKDVSDDSSNDVIENDTVSEEAEHQVMNEDLPPTSLDQLMGN